MQTLYFDLRDTKGQQKEIEDKISAAAKLLREGSLVAIPTETVYGLGANGLYADSILKSLVVEAILTFVFVLAVLGVTAKREYASVAGLVIGLSLTLVHLFGIYFTGTSVNPARSLGPALLLGGDALRVVWVFVVGPLAGGALAAGAYRVLAGRPKTEARKRK